MKRLITLVVLALTCAGCGYHKMPKLEHLKRSAASVVKRDNKVEIRARAVDRKELRTMFGVFAFFKRVPYHCVWVTIKNKSNVPVVFDTKRLSHVVLVDKVAAAYFGCTPASCNNTAGQAAYYIIGGGAAAAVSALALVYLPIIAMFSTDSCTSALVPYSILGAAVAIPVILFTAFLRNDPVACNRQLMMQLRERILNELVVEPGSMGSTLVFIKQDPASKELVLPVRRLTDKKVLTVGTLALPQALK